VNCVSFFICSEFYHADGSIFERQNDLTSNTCIAILCIAMHCIVSCN